MRIQCRHHRSSLKTTVKQHPIQNLHALIIGINKYKHSGIPILRGAVKDAESMNEYLRSHLGVRSNQIILLTDDNATRSAITDSLIKLSEETRIKPFDPILIYFAGHGCELGFPASNYGTYSEKVQCLLPCDAWQQNGEETVLPIPDFILGSLLNKLAAKKGNNITVIFDCCHSASITRGYQLTDDRGLVFKSIQPKGSIAGGVEFTRQGCRHDHPQARTVDSAMFPVLTTPMAQSLFTEFAHFTSHGSEKLSQRRWRTVRLYATTFIRFRRAGFKPSRVSNSKSDLIFRGSRRSHVLIAACGQDESAYECKECYRGYFTSAFLELLRSFPLHNVELKTLLMNLKLPPQLSQNPVCEGGNICRLFSNNCGTDCKHWKYLPVHISQPENDESIKILVGEAQGAIPGSELRLRENVGFYNQPRSYRAGSYHDYPPVTVTMSQTGPDPCASWCKLPKNTRLPIHHRILQAELLKRGKHHRFFVANALKWKITDNTKCMLDDHGVILVNRRDEAMVLLETNGQPSGQVAFEYYGFRWPLPTCQPGQLEAKIYRILFFMAQWHWHLTREPGPRYIIGILGKIWSHSKPSKISSHHAQIFYRVRICCRIIRIIHKWTPKWAQLSIWRVNGTHPLPINNGLVCLTGTPGDQYYLKLKNMSKRRLYPYLFYFSTKHQSMRPLYLKIYGNGDVRAPLRPNGELTFGYKNDDLIPGALSFGDAPDVVYFRVFLTTSPGDFDSVSQRSPFVVRSEKGNGYFDGLKIQKAYEQNPIDLGRRADEKDHVVTPYPISSFKEIVHTSRGLCAKAASGSTKRREILSDSQASRLITSKSQPGRWSVDTLKVTISARRKSSESSSSSSSHRSRRPRL